MDEVFGLVFGSIFRKFVVIFPRYLFRILQPNFDIAIVSTSRSHSINVKLLTLLLKVWGAQRL